MLSEVPGKKQMGSAGSNKTEEWFCNVSISMLFKKKYIPKKAKLTSLLYHLLTLSEMQNNNWNHVYNHKA